MPENMSSSSEIVDFSEQKPARMSEMLTFSQKCGMFNQYLKEKGSFGDLSLGMSCSVEPNGTSDVFRQTTKMNLFPVTEKPSKLEAPQDFKSMNLFPMQAVFGSYVPREGISKIGDYSVNKPASGEPTRAQMTIFYGGQVYVFDDFSADKAKEVMILASKEISETHPANNNVAFPSHLTKNPTDSSNSVPSNSAAIQPPSRPIICDLPIARKASLHRFLEKRKDRINAKAPYQIGSLASTSTKPDETKPWLGLAARPKQ